MAARTRAHGGVLYRIKRDLYPNGRPGRLARVLNRMWATVFATGAFRRATHAATLEVRGRRTGRLISFPVVVADLDGERYLVAMLGNEANWVRNVRAADGDAAIRQGSRERVLLEEVDVASRAPILRRYVDVAPGARPHIPVSRGAALEEFERIAGRFPVFRIVPAPTERLGQG